MTAFRRSRRLCHSDLRPRWELSDSIPSSVIDGMSLLVEAAVVVGGDQSRGPSTRFPGVPVSSSSSHTSPTPARYSVRHHPESRSASAQDIVPTSANISAPAPQPPVTTPSSTQTTHVIYNHLLLISEPHIFYSGCVSVPKTRLRCDLI